MSSKLRPVSRFLPLLLFCILGYLGDTVEVAGCIDEEASKICQAIVKRKLCDRAVKRHGCKKSCHNCVASPDSKDTGLSIKEAFELTKEIAENSDKKRISKDSTQKEKVKASTVEESAEQIEDSLEKVEDSKAKHPSKSKVENELLTEEVFEKPAPIDEGYLDEHSTEKQQGEMQDTSSAQEGNKSGEEEDEPVISSPSQLLKMPSGRYKIKPKGAESAEWAFVDNEYDGGRWVKVLETAKAQKLPLDKASNIGKAWTAQQISGEMGKLSTKLWNLLWTGESRKSFLIRTSESVKTNFLNHGKGTAKWVSEGFDWPDWGIPFRAPGSDEDVTYTVYYDKESTGEFNNYVHYGKDLTRDPCEPINEEVWIYDKNFNYIDRHLDTKTTGKCCFTFTTSGLKPRMRFLGAYDGDGKFSQGEAIPDFVVDNLSIWIRYGPVEISEEEIDVEELYTDDDGNVDEYEDEVSSVEDPVNGTPDKVSESNPSVHHTEKSEKVKDLEEKQDNKVVVAITDEKEVETSAEDEIALGDENHKETPDSEVLNSTSATVNDEDEVIKTKEEGGGSEDKNIKELITMEDDTVSHIKDEKEEKVDTDHEIVKKDHSDDEERYDPEVEEIDTKGYNPELELESKGDEEIVKKGKNSAEIDRDSNNESVDVKKDDLVDTENESHKAEIDSDEMSSPEEEPYDVDDVDKNIVENMREKKNLKEETVVDSDEMTSPEVELVDHKVEDNSKKERKEPNDSGKLESEKEEAKDAPGKLKPKLKEDDREDNAQLVNITDNEENDDTRNEHSNEENDLKNKSGAIEEIVEDNGGYEENPNLLDQSIKNEQNKDTAKQDTDADEDLYDDKSVDANSGEEMNDSAKWGSEDDQISSKKESVMESEEDEDMYSIESGDSEPKVPLSIDSHGSDEEPEKGAIQVEESEENSDDSYYDTEQNKKIDLELAKAINAAITNEDIPEVEDILELKLEVAKNPPKLQVNDLTTNVSFRVLNTNSFPRDTKYIVSWWHDNPTSVSRNKGRLQLIQPYWTVSVFNGLPYVFKVTAQTTDGKMLGQIKKHVRTEGTMSPAFDTLKLHARMNKKDFDLVTNGNDLSRSSDKQLILRWIGETGDPDDFEFIVKREGSITTITCLLKNRFDIDITSFMKAKGLVERIRGLLYTKFKAFDVSVAQTRKPPEEIENGSFFGTGNSTIFALSGIVLLAVIFYFYVKKGDFRKLAGERYQRLVQDVEIGGGASSVFHSGESPAQLLVKEALTKLGFPGFTIPKYLDKLREYHITTIEQLKSLDTNDWARLDVESTIQEAIRKELEEREIAAHKSPKLLHKRLKLRTAKSPSTAGYGAVREQSSSKPSSKVPTPKAAKPPVLAVSSGGEWDTGWDSEDDDNL